MKIFKISLCLVLILTVLLTSVGCWNYEDVDQLFIVSGLAVDKDLETGEYLLSFEIIKAKGGEQEMGVSIVSVRSDTVYGGIRDAIQQIGKKLYWGHTSLCFISDNIVEEGLFLTLDVIARATDLKADIFLCYIESDKIEEVFKVEDEIHDTVSGHMLDLFNESLSSGKYVSAPLYKILKELSESNGTMLLPVLEIIEENEKKYLVANASVAVTKDQFIGYVDEIQTRSVQLLQNSDFKKGYGVTMKANDYIPGAAIEVIDTKRKIEPIIEENQLKMKIELELECELAELESSVDYISDERKGKLENGFEQLIKKQVSDTITYAQKELEKDIFSFHTVVFQQQPNYWREVEGHWLEIFKTMPCDIFVDINIYSSESNKKPLGYTGE